MNNIKKELCNKFYTNWEGNKELHCEEGYRLVILYFPLEMATNDENLIDKVVNLINKNEIECYYYDCSQYEDIHENYYEFSICVDDQKIKKFNNIWKVVKKELKTGYKNALSKIEKVNEIKNELNELYEVAEEIKEIKENVKKEELDILIDYRKVIVTYDSLLVFEILAKIYNNFLEVETEKIINKYNESFLNDLNVKLFLQTRNLKEYLNKLLIAYHKVSKKQTDTNIIGLIKEYNENDGKINASKFEDPEAIVDILNSEEVGVMYDRNNKIIIPELPF